MKKRWKLLLTLGLALVAVSVLAYLGIATPPDIPNLVKYHKETHDSLNQVNANATSQNCIKCHGDKRTESDLSNYYTSAHKKHNMSVYLRFNLLTPYDNDGDGQVNEDPPDAGPIQIDDDGDGIFDEDGVESECAKCHWQTDTSLGQVTTNERGDVIFPNAEESFEDGLLDDIIPHSDRVARKQVDPALFVSCHVGFTTVESTFDDPSDPPLTGPWDFQK